MQTVLLKSTPQQTVRVVKNVFLGTRDDFKTTHDDGLVTHHSLLHPIMVRPKDNNKYEPHQSTKEMNRRIKQNG
jgi:hypothetical protein